MTLAVFLPMLLAAVCAWLGPRLGRRTGYVAALAFLPALLLALPLSRLPASAAGGPPALEVTRWVPTLDLSLAFRGDGFSLLFAVLIGVIGTLSALYSVAYLSERERFGRFYAYLLLFGGSMLGLVLSDNLIALFAFWEMTSVSSFLLIGLWHTRSAARDGAVKAFLVSALGGLALLAAVVLIFLAGGGTSLSGLDLDALRASPLFVPALLLTLVAAFTKSAQLPFHLWLPTAMEAPTPVSAFLHSATMVKAGVLLVAKFGVLFGSSPLWSAVIVPVGLLTLVWGAWIALRQTDLKALLAYSTISQLGLLMSLYGLADPEGRFTATAHLLNHAAFKAALFFVVGIIDHETGTREVPLLGGLRRLLPLTFVAALVAVLSMAGLPPFGGFISKELFFEVMLHQGPVFIAVAVIGSALTLAYSFRLLSVFWGPVRHPPQITPHEAPPGLLAPAAGLAALALLFGLLPASAEALTRTAQYALNFSGYSGYLSLWHGVTPALLATFVTWGLGAVMVWQTERLMALGRRLAPQINANTVYYACTEGINVLSSRLIARTQGLALPDQLRIMLASAGLISAFAVLRAPQVFHPIGTPPLSLLPVAALLVAGALGVLLARSRLTAVVVTGLTGFGSAAAFLGLSAPDLALTQLLVEAVTVLLFLLAFRYLPRSRDLPRTRWRYALDLLLAASAGLGATLLVLAGVRFLAPPISPYYLENSYTQGGGKNVVNVLLVDFRGFDTLGEIVVVGMVALAVLSLVRLGKPGRLPSERLPNELPGALPSERPTERASRQPRIQNAGSRPSATPSPTREER